jgi:ORF6N domain
MAKTPLKADNLAPLIYWVRGEKVILSQDLAALYDVTVSALNQAVKRNIERFPNDFMFRLERDEFDQLKSQIVTSSWGGIRRALPLAFTEQGIAMLSSVLRGNQRGHSGYSLPIQPKSPIYLDGHRGLMALDGVFRPISTRFRDFSSENRPV